MIGPWIKNDVDHRPVVRGRWFREDENGIRAIVYILGVAPVQYGWTAWRDDGTSICGKQSALGAAQDAADGVLAEAVEPYWPLHFRSATPFCPGGRSDTGDWTQVTCPDCLRGQRAVLLEDVARVSKQLLRAMDMSGIEFRSGGPLALLRALLMNLDNLEKR